MLKRVCLLMAPYYAGRMIFSENRVPLFQDHALWRAAPPYLVQELVHAAAQAMHLVDEVQDDRDAFVVDPEIVAQIADQDRAREVDLGKSQLRLALRHQPSG